MAIEGNSSHPSVGKLRHDVGEPDRARWLTSQGASAEPTPTTRRHTYTDPEQSVTESTTGDVVDLTSSDPDVLINLAGARLMAPATGLTAAPRWKLMVKRLIDVVGAAVAIAITAPILTISALAVVLETPGGALFRQTRLGKDGRPFMLWKLRSMVADAESRLDDVLSMNEMDGPVFKIKQDPRVTTVGGVLRKLSIDELPQLFQVLTGRMSLVGVRPPLPSEALAYDDRTRQRLLVKPGITCIWQTSGRSELSFEEWVRMDLEYIETWSLWLDIKLLVKTIPAVFSRRGAY